MPAPTGARIQPRLSRRSPAARYDEMPAAAPVHPDARTIPAPRLAFDARGIGILALQTHLSARADVHLAEITAILRAAARHHEFAIPARPGSPAAVAGSEHAAAALVDPDAAAIVAPGLTFDAGGF